MDILIEIHIPGLDLHSSRWSLHKLFLEEIEDVHEWVAAAAYRWYKQQGRGTVVVDPEQWMEILEGNWHDHFPSKYYSADMTIEEMEFGQLGEGFRQLLDNYDPEQQVLLSVHHHPGEMVSCYLLAGDHSPPECYERVYGSE